MIALTTHTTTTTELESFAAYCADLRTESGSPMRLEAFQRTILRVLFGGAAETLILRAQNTWEVNAAFGDCAGLPAHDGDADR